MFFTLFCYILDLDLLFHPWPFRTVRHKMLCISIPEIASPISAIKHTIIIKVFTAVKNDLIVYVLHFLRSRFDMGFTFRTLANTEGSLTRRGSRVQRPHAIPLYPKCNVYKIYI